MKKLLFILLSLNIIIMPAYAETFTSVKTGNWSDGATWDQSGSVPGAGDDVVIADGHNVTVSTTQDAKTLIINATDGSNYGTLTVTTGSVLTTSDNITINGKLVMSDGVLNVGTSSGDRLIIHGGVLGSDCELALSGGTINVNRYFDMVSGSSFNMSGGTMNINNAGGSSSNTDIFDVPAGTSFTITTGTINILNGNLGTGVALKYNPTTSAVSGGTFNIQNMKNYASVTITCSKNINNLSCDVGSGNVLYINNMASDTDGFEVNDFTITSGTSQLDAGEMMTINGTASLGTGNFTIASNSSGNGSLIASGTVTGTATVERYIEAYSGDADGWHNISSPVNNMVISGSDFDPGPNDDLFAWSESENMWKNYKQGSFSNFTNGQGYLVAYLNTATKSFNGTLNIADVDFLNLSVGSGSGWHLLGNPFASALQWNNGSWAITAISAVAKIWNETAGNYSDISANGYIPSTNGFFVQATNATNSLTIPASARVHNSQNNYKSRSGVTNNETLIVKVINDQNSFFDVNTIGFNADATEEWDVDFDSRKLYGNAKAPQIWTSVSGEEFSTNFLPYVVESYVLPLNFQAGVDGLYEFSFEGLESFFLNSNISLEDKLTRNIIDLVETPFYSFSALTTDASDRFLLHFFGVTNMDETVIDFNTVSIYSNNHDLYIKSKLNKAINGKVVVYNTMGQKVFEDDIHNTSYYFTTLELQRGHYVVCLITEQQLITKKVFLTKQTR